MVPLSHLKEMCLVFYQPSKDDSRQLYKLPLSIETHIPKSPTTYCLFCIKLVHCSGLSSVTLIYFGNNCSLSTLHITAVVTLYHTRQQITLYINFTCDGVTTKRIVGGFWVNISVLIPGPELPHTVVSITHVQCTLMQ